MQRTTKITTTQEREIEMNKIETIKSQIRKAYDENREYAASGFIPMTWVREYTAGYGTRDEVDQVIRSMLRAGEIFTTEETNQKALRRADREAAVYIGAQYDHYLRFQR